MKKDPKPVLHVPRATQLDADERLAVFGELVNIDAGDSDQIFELVREPNLRQDRLRFVFSKAI